jgi:hypothetical protein
MTGAWEAMMWSFKALYDGRFPENDWNGKPWASTSSEALLAKEHLCSASEEFFCVIWSVKGDLDWYAKSLGLNSYNANEPCPYCPVSKLKSKHFWPTNFSLTAPWKIQQISAADWRASVGYLHPIFKGFEFLSVLNVEVDELHVLYLGISQYFLGSILWMLTYTMVAGTPEQAFAKIWAAILEQYKIQNTGVQYSQMAISSFVTPAKAKKEYPRLKGRGAEIKGLVDPLIAVFAKFKKRSEHDARVQETMEALSHMQAILDEFKYDAFLSAPGAKKFQEETDKFLNGYTLLGLDCDRKQQLGFTAAPKLHWLWHMAFRSKFLNPRRVACFIDEDFVNHMKHIAARCCSGTQLHNVPTSLMKKYRWGLYLESVSVTPQE